jgi:hypothetical protein
MLSNSLHWLAVATCSNQWLIGTQQLAWLHFDTVANQSSALVPLVLDNSVGLQSDGTEARNFAPQAGRVLVVGDEPLLEAIRTDNGEVRLILYSNLGLTNRLEFTGQLGVGPAWQPAGELVATNLFNQLPPFVPLDEDEQRFYRAKLK